MGRDALLRQDFHTIAELMDRNFDLRKSVGTLISVHAQL